MTLFRAVFVSILWISASLLSADAQIFGVQVDPDLQWQTITSDHFRVHFHEGLAGVAFETIEIAEEAYAVIKEEFGYAPDSFDVVILDAFDFPNGSANPLYDGIVLITSHYRLSDWANIRLDSWWRMLIFHELVHAIELDMNNGIPKVIRQIFGKISVPNLIKPIPFTEGLAVYEKFKYLGESRLNDSRTQMIIRQMIIDNKIPDFEDIKQTYSSTSWPTPGFLVYNFGSWLMRYIEETFGDDAMRRFDEANSSNIMNLLFTSDLNETIEKTFEVSADELYEGFRHWLRNQYKENIQQIQSEKLTRPVKLTSTGFVTTHPAWSPNDEWIAYTHGGPGRGGLRLVSPEGENDHEIANGAGVSFPTWSNNSRFLVYRKIDYNSSHNIHSDLYLYDVERNSERRLTTGARAYFARFSPDGTSIYFAKNHGRDGSTALAKLDLETDEISIIYEFDSGDETLHSFSLSPDGDQIALALTKRGGYQDLYLMPIRGGALTPITQNKDQVSDPTWTADGEYILFSADPNRVYNIYAYELATENFFRVTNVISGAFYPTISPDGYEIAFGGYEGSGYDIYKIPYDPSTWSQVELAQETIPEWGGYPAHEMSFVPYNAFSHLKPRAWLPIPLEDGNGFGAWIFGLDPLFKFNYGLIVGWNMLHEELYYEFAVTVQNSFPTSILLNSGPEGHSESINFNIPLSTSFFGSQTLNLGYSRENSHPTNQDDEIDFEIEKSKTESVSVTYSHNSTWRDDLFADAMNLSVGTRLWKHEFGKNWYKRVVLNWTESIRLPVLQTHVFQTNVKAGWTDGSEEQDNFELGGQDEEFPLRGFEVAKFSGSQVARGSIEQSFHLLSLERGIGHWPVFLDDLGLNVFLDAGVAGDQLSLHDLKLGFGLEFTLRSTISYFLPIELIAGIAQGIGEEQPLFYFGFSVPGLFQ